MVGLVLVSHSRRLAEAVRELVLQMTGPGFPIGVAGGVGEAHQELGTDAVHIADVLSQLRCPEGVLVLMDLGSAVLSAQTALELLELSGNPAIRLCPAPLVEGAIAAAVRAQAGGSLDEVAHEAELGLAAKQQQLLCENSVELPATEAPCTTATPDESVELVLTVENQHGLHARPAAALVQLASRFTSSTEVSNLTAGRGPASARSLTSLALLQVRKGDRIKILCHGSDCQVAAQAIRQLAAAGFGEKSEATLAPVPATTRPIGTLRSSGGSDGIAIGPLAAMQTVELCEEEPPVGDPSAEMAKLTAAMKSVSDEVRPGQTGNAPASIGSQAILEAQALILADPIVLSKAKSLVEGDRLSAARAWISVTREVAAQYEAMDDPYLRERAADVRDIARRVLKQMQGGESSPSMRPDRPSILYTDELLPSEAAECDPSLVLGVITAKGSATSHSAIILRTLGIPMVVGAAGIGEADAGKTVAMNGSTGEIWIEPDTAIIAKVEEEKQLQLAHRRRAELAKTQASITLDGTRMEVLANVGNVHDAAAAAENGAEGVGLLRTEFLFVSRSQAPTEDEQIQTLCEIYAQISGPIIVRTLDVGADKPLSFLPQPEEHNPFLGVRGIRLSLHAPDLFLTHLRAILRSGVGHDIWLMLPMISVVQEVYESFRLLGEAHQQLQAEWTPHVWPVKRGVMIEVPSAALVSVQLAEDVDFFSIGTNDLTQYTMAAERGSAAVAGLQDALHPAVLHLMKSVAEGASVRGRHVSVCGDAASDPASAAIFAGLGIHSLSTRPKQVPQIKSLFRELRTAELKKIAVQAMHCREAAEVRELVRHYLDGAKAAAQGQIVARDS